MKVKGTFETKRGLPSGAVSRRVKIKIAIFENRFCDMGKYRTEMCGIFMVTKVYKNK